jgi:hypothetical protein
MKILTHQEETILNDLKACLKGFGLPIVEETTVNEKPVIVSKFQYEHYGFGIVVTYHAEEEFVAIEIYYGNAPDDKIKPLCELMNHINTHIMSGHFFVAHPSGEMSFRAAVHTPDSLNQEEFEWALKQVMGASYKCFPMIVEQLFTNGDPKEIMEKHLAQEPVEVDS